MHAAQNLDRGHMTVTTPAAARSSRSLSERASSQPDPCVSSWSSHGPPNAVSAAILTSDVASDTATLGSLLNTAENLSLEGACSSNECLHRSTFLIAVHF